MDKDNSIVEMDKKEFLNMLRDIGLALHACNNCVTTDTVGVEVKSGSWRVDNSKEIALVHSLEERFGVVR